MQEREDEKEIKMCNAIAVDELPLCLKIEGSCIKVSKSILYSDLFNTVDLFFHHKHLVSKEIGNGFIFACAQFSFFLLRNKKSVFFFDSHIWEENGSHVPPNGQSVLKE